MVYATCSILPQENQHQVELFLTSKPGWHLLKEEIRLPHRQPFDGFYAALLQRED